MKALTFIIRFQTAQFKVHFQKLTRRTYLIPPPSAVAGIFCGILGVPRNELKDYCEAQKILVGAELRRLEGFYTTISRIFKFDRDERGLVRLLNKWSKTPRDGRVYKDIVGLMPIKESEELFRPEYKIAIAANDEVISEGLRRLRNLDFEYEVFGGNDYHFVDYIGDPNEARYVKSKEGSGYCPAEDLQSIKSQEFRVVINCKHLSRTNAQLPIVMFSPVGPEMRCFVFAYGARLVTKSERSAVKDEDSTIFVYDPVRCIIP